MITLEIQWLWIKGADVLLSTLCLLCLAEHDTFVDKYYIEKRSNLENNPFWGFPEETGTIIYGSVALLAFAQDKNTHQATVFRNCCFQNRIVQFESTAIDRSKSYVYYSTKL